MTPTWEEKHACAWVSRYTGTVPRCRHLLLKKCSWKHTQNCSCAPLDQVVRRQQDCSPLLFIRTEFWKLFPQTWRRSRPSLCSHKTIKTTTGRTTLLDSSSVDLGKRNDQPDRSKYNGSQTQKYTVDHISNMSAMTIKEKHDAMVGIHIMRQYTATTR